MDILPKNPGHVAEKDSENPESSISVKPPDPKETAIVSEVAGKALDASATLDTPTSEVENPADNGSVVKDGALATKFGKTPLPASKDLEQAAKILQKDPLFLEQFKQQALETVKLYVKVLKSPSLIGKGFIEAFKDIFIELPKSLFKKRPYQNNAQRLEAKSSQALAISEVSTIPGTFGGIAALEAFGISGKIAGPVGAILGSYLSGALSFVVSYVLLTRFKSDENYTVGKSLKDSFSTVRDCLPAAAVLYGVNGPIMTGLMSLGLSSTVAATILNIWVMILFIGVAKLSIKENIEKGAPVV